MTKTITSIVIMIVCLTGCSSPEPMNSISSETAIDSVKQIKALNEQLKKYEEPSQFFTIPTNTLSKVKGKQGTVISVNPFELVNENGEAPGKTIEVELKELVNQEQLLRTNAQTISDEKILVSGGAYYINLTSEGKQLKIKDGKSLSVDFPKFSKKDMSLFYGERDSLGNMQWQPTNQIFENKIKATEVKKAKLKSDTTADDIDFILGYVEDETPLTEKEKKEQKKQSALEDNIYKSIQINRLGWINCDRFYEVPNLTDIQVSFNKADSIKSANIYLVFKDINSIMQIQYFSVRGRVYTKFKNMPVGAKTILVAFSLKNEKLYSSKIDLTIEANKTIELSMQETTEAQMNKLFKF